MEIVESFLKKNPCYKAGKKIRVGGLMLHSVGCPPAVGGSLYRELERCGSGTCLCPCIYRKQGEGRTGHLSGKTADESGHL